MRVLCEEHLSHGCDCAPAANATSDHTVVTDEAWPGPPEPLRNRLPLPDSAQVGIVGEFTRAVSASLEQPADYTYLAALVAVSGATFGRAEIEVADGHAEPLAIYAMPAMDSGTRKSSALKMVTEPMSSWQQQQQELWRMEGGHIRLEMAEEELKSARRGSRSDDGADQFARIQVAEMEVERLRAQRPRQLLAASDSTTEALSLFLARNGGAGCVMSAEGGLVGNLAGRYSQGDGNLDLVLSAHSHEAFLTDRVGRDPIHIEKAHLALFVGAQPHVLREMRSNSAMDSRGFVSRFLIALPASRLGYRTGVTEVVPDYLVKRWRDCLTKVIDEFHRADEVRTLRFTPDAAEEYQAEWSRVELMFRPGGALTGAPGLQAWGGKLPGQLARVAAVLALLDDPTVTSIGVGHWRAAQSLADYLIHHARRAWSVLEKSPATHVLDHLRDKRPWESSEENGGALMVSTRELYQSLRGQTSWLESVEDVRDGLEVLATHNLVRRIHVDPSAKGGRPSELWQVNPVLAGQPAPPTDDTTAEESSVDEDAIEEIAEVVAMAAPSVQTDWQVSQTPFGGTDE